MGLSTCCHLNQAYQAGNKMTGADVLPSGGKREEDFRQFLDDKIYKYVASANLRLKFGIFANSI
jgi:hypothetical protein